jgi:hypothetical protein
MGEIDFEKLAQELTAARRMLKERVSALEAEISALKKKQLPAIRKWAEAAAEKQQALHQAIEENPVCFVKPKTMILHGIRFGWQKQKGETLWEDDAKVVALIRKYFPDLEDVLIKTTETPVKKTLGQLAAADLKKLGVSVENDTDEVFIKATDSEIDKIVDAILKTETE